MNALANFTRQLDHGQLADMFAGFDAPASGAVPRAVLAALSRAGSGQIIRSRSAQVWLTQEHGVNMGRHNNRHEVGAVFVDYDWRVKQWRVIGGAA